MSFTVTSKLHCVWFPAASVAVAVTVVVPTGKVLPEAGVLTTETPGKLSVAVTVKFTTAPQTLASLSVVISPTHVITGGSVSIMLNIVNGMGDNT